MKRLNSITSKKSGKGAPPPDSPAGFFGNKPMGSLKNI